MTGNEKAGIAAFLDLAGDYLSGGYHKNHEAREFPDDPADVEPQVAGEPAGAADNGDSLAAIAADVAACDKCGLCTTRTNTVPGEGVPHPLVMVIGEGPGADEDASGKPFVGRAGQLLDRILDSKGKIGLSRESNCYIANVVKCRPPGNRNPEPEEAAACFSFLRRQILLLRPLAILSAGNVPTKTLLDTSDGITKLRGHWTNFTLTGSAGGSSPDSAALNIPLLPTFHPSALLRDESLKAPVWEDMKTLRAKLAELSADYAAQIANIPL